MKIILVLSLIFHLSSPLFAADPLPLKKDGDAKWGWFAFGHGIQDSGVSRGDEGYWMAIDWPATTWGNGTFYKFASPVDASGYKKISFKAGSQLPTKAGIRVEMMTEDNAVIGTPTDKAMILKDGQETLIEVDVATLVPIQAEKNQREFRIPDDLKAIDRVQILIMKPDGEDKNILKFKDMKLLP